MSGIISAFRFKDTDLCAQFLILLVILKDNIGRCSIGVRLMEMKTYNHIIKYGW